MRRIQKALILGFGAILLWTGLALGGQGYTGAWGSIKSGAGRRWVQFRGHILCASGALEAKRAVSASHFYQLNHRRGQVIVKVTAGAAALPYHSLWLNGEDRLFETLAAEENLFKEVEISGLLREYRPALGILDLPTVQIRD